MLDEILSQTEKRMESTVSDYKQKLATVRTGRASLGILDGITVEYYGTPSPLNQVAKLSVPDPTLIVAQPFDPTMMQSVEKAIQASGLGLNPSNDGKVIRIPIPPLTEDRRKQLAKRVHQLLEDAKTAIRQIRRDSNEEIKRLEKAGDISEDDARRRLEEVQKKTDAHSSVAETLCKNKESELLEV